MTKYRHSKSFMWAMFGLCPLLIAAGYVLNRNSQSVLSNGKSASGGYKQPVREIASSKFRDTNTKRVSLDASAQRREAWFQEILARHPDMAVASKNVPDDQNGFLKWLDFEERFKETNPDGLAFPKELSDYINHQGEWNPEAARAWLAQQKTLLDEIRAIGLMPDQSSHGIKIDRYGFIGARLLKACAEALVIEARLAAGDGNAASALESIRAANGIGDHLNQIETPSLLTETMTTLIRLKIQNSALTEIMQALPADAIDVAAWEEALHPRAATPAEFGRILKGEWNVGMQQFVLPILTTGEPGTPPDPEEFIDTHTELYRRVIAANSSQDPKELTSNTVPLLPSSAGLSQESRNLYDEEIATTAFAWRKGWTRAQSAYGMHQAAFAILKGQPIPTDPIHGLPYVWDPATRTLSPPANHAFKDLELKPIIIPNP